MSLSALQSATASVVIKWINAALNVLGRTNPNTDSETFAQSLSLGLGTGAGDVDTIVSTVRSIGASGSDTITLSTMAATGSPTTINDIFGQAVTLARVRAILIQLLGPTDGASGQTATGPDDPDPTDAASITIGDAASHPWTAVFSSTGTYTINNGGSWCHVDDTTNGLVVTSGTSEQLKIVNNDSGLAAIYRLVILGCSE